MKSYGRRGSLAPLSRAVKNIVAQEARERVRSAFLVDPYIGYVREIMIQLGDPALGRGAMVRATVRPGFTTGTLPAGTAVSVICRHGHYEIIGLRSVA